MPTEVVTPVVKLVVLQYLPMGHRADAVNAAEEQNEPISHGVGTDIPVVAQYRPAGQLMQAVMPGVAQYLLAILAVWALSPVVAQA